MAVKEPGISFKKARSGWKEINLHFDAGLINDGKQKPFVNPILQMLLHVPLFAEFVESDTDHRKSCRSTLNCLTCGLYKLSTSMKNLGSAQPNLFLFKLTKTKCVDAALFLEQLFVALNLEFALRSGRKQFELGNMACAPVNQMFASLKKTRGECSSCGLKNVTIPFNTVRLTQSEVPFQESLQAECLKGELMQCFSCEKEMINYETDSITLAPYLFISLERESSDTKAFDIPKSLVIQGKRFTFLACACENVSFTQCPDGHTRLQQDLLVVAMSFASFMKTAALKGGSILLCYSRGDKSTEVKKKKVFMRNDYLETKRGDVTEEEGNFGETSDKEPSDIEVWDHNDEAKHDESSNRLGCKSTQTHVPKREEVAVQVKIRPECNDVATQVNFLDFELISTTEKFKFWTGLSVEDFEVLYSLIGGKECMSKVKFNYRLDTPKKVKEEKFLKISYKDRLFMFLLRLRRGLPLEELAWMSGMGVSQTGEICYVMTRTVQLGLKQVEPRCFPSAAKQRLTKPAPMRPWRNLRILLDGVEFRTEMPSNFHMQGNLYSKYKHCNTVRFIVGISCDGTTIFVSPAAEGALSEKEAVLQGGLLEKLDKGDVVMTDRGFEMASELHAVGAVLVKPPTGGNPDGFNEAELMLTKAIAPARIYTEHAMAEIKDNRLLQGTIPLSLYSMLPDLVYIAAYLRNFSPSRVRSKPLGQTNNDNVYRLSTLFEEQL